MGEEESPHIRLLGEEVIGEVLGEVLSPVFIVNDAVVGEAEAGRAERDGQCVLCDGRVPKEHACPSPRGNRGECCGTYEYRGAAAATAAIAISRHCASCRV